MPNASDLICLFNNLFEHSEETILVGGGIEPLYRPKDEKFPLHRVIFTQDYFASALHEIAHWCIAGKQRRMLVDYGYWYHPDGRNAEQQKIFEQVEVKPQALEWIFSLAAGSSFQVSFDNLSGENQGDKEKFTREVKNQMQQYLQYGLPARAELFRQRLDSLYC